MLIQDPTERYKCVSPTEEGYLGLSHPLQEQYLSKVKVMTEWIPGNLQAWVPVPCTARVSWPDQQESLLSCTSIPARVGPSDWGHLSQEIWLLQFPSILYYSSQKTRQKFFLNMSVKQDSIFVSVFEKFSKSSPSSNPELLLLLDVFNIEPTFMLTNL